MAKPIALFLYPLNMFDVGDTQRVSAADVIQIFNKSMPDYHWLCFPSEYIRYPKLSVYRDEEFTDIEHDDLMALIKRKCENIKNEKVL